MKLYAFKLNRRGDPELTWRLNVTPAWAKRHDNGHLVSIGIEVPTELSIRSLMTLTRLGRATLCPTDEWQHGSCQSACRRRGDTVCRW